MDTAAMTSWRVVRLFTAAMLVPAAAGAQPLGTFRWQFAPYCNTVTILVEQKAGVFELSGTDNQCGAAVTAAARGTAHLNPNGTVGIGLTVARPDGLAVASTISLDLATLSGTWRDEYGNAGSFQHNPPVAPAGSPRPVTLRGNYAVLFTAAAGSALGASVIGFGRALPSPPSVTDADIIAEGATPTVRCPGTADAPQAAPGVLCLYERSRVNVVTTGVRTDNNAVSTSDPFGAFVFARANAAGPVSAIGTWAMSVP